MSKVIPPHSLIGIPVQVLNDDLTLMPSILIRMDAEREIKRAQQDWARSRVIAFDRDGYVAQGESNLYRPLSDRAKLAFEAGSGAELRGRMRALHSSSALVANFFDYWTERNMAPILNALGIAHDNGVALDFEAQFHTGLGGTPPHLDVTITHSTGFVVAIESKFTEHLKWSTRGKSQFAPSYFPEQGGLWAKRGLPASPELAESLRAEELCGGRQRFEYLDPRQLLKHALGLSTQLYSEFSLCYLYYDWSSERIKAHRREINLFEEWVGAELRFRALTYQKVFAKLSKSGQAGTGYLDYLGSRYFGGGA